MVPLALGARSPDVLLVKKLDIEAILDQPLKVKSLLLLLRGSD